VEAREFDTQEENLFFLGQDVIDTLFYDMAHTPNVARRFLLSARKFEGRMARVNTGIRSRESIKNRAVLAKNFFSISETFTAGYSELIGAIAKANPTIDGRTFFFPRHLASMIAETPQIVTMLLHMHQDSQGSEEFYEKALPIIGPYVKEEDTPQLKKDIESVIIAVVGMFGDMVYGENPLETVVTKYQKNHASAEYKTIRQAARHWYLVDRKFDRPNLVIAALGNTSLGELLPVIAYRYGLDFLLRQTELNGQRIGPLHTHMGITTEEQQLLAIKDGPSALRKTYYKEIKLPNGKISSLDIEIDEIRKYLFNFLKDFYTKRTAFGASAMLTPIGESVRTRLARYKKEQGRRIIDEEYQAMELSQSLRHIASAQGYPTNRLDEVLYVLLQTHIREKDFFPRIFYSFLREKKLFPSASELAQKIAELFPENTGEYTLPIQQYAYFRSRAIAMILLRANALGREDRSYSVTYDDSTHSAVVSWNGKAKFTIEMQNSTYLGLVDSFEGQVRQLLDVIQHKASPSLSLATLWHEAKLPVTQEIDVQVEGFLRDFNYFSQRSSDQFPRQYERVLQKKQRYYLSLLVAHITLAFPNASEELGFTVTVVNKSQGQKTALLLRHPSLRRGVIAVRLSKNLCLALAKENPSIIERYITVLQRAMSRGQTEFR